MKSKLLFYLALVSAGALWGNHSAAAIIYPKAPEGGTNLVYKFASGIVKFDPRFLRVAHVQDLSIGKPCRAYSAGLEDLAAGKFLSVAQAGSWEYPLFHGPDADGLAFVLADETTGKATNCDGIFQSDMGRREAVQIAEALPQVQKQNYEMRELDMPGLLFKAIWLHAESDDIIIPTGNSFGRWNPDLPYSEKEMLEVLKPLAKKKLKEPPGMLD
jgi:hypothetical protein